MFYSFAKFIEFCKILAYTDCTIIISKKKPSRRFYKISVLFFQEQPFYNFPGGSICSSNRHCFSRRVYNVHRTDTNFLRGFNKNSCFFKEIQSVCRTDHIISSDRLCPQTHTNFPGGSIFPSNRYSFSRKPYLVFKHIIIYNFQENPLP